MPNSNRPFVFVYDSAFAFVFLWFSSSFNIMVREARFLTRISLNMKS
jgi:hypothetical protein